MEEGEEAEGAKTLNAPAFFHAWSSSSLHVLLCVLVIVIFMVVEI